MGPSGLRARAREAFAAKWLNPDDSADHRAVYIRITGGHRGADLNGEAFNAAVDPQCQAITSSGEWFSSGRKIGGVIANNMKDRAKDLLLKERREGISASTGPKK
jgi:hypothetical protein